jgi:hypothetical protein
VVDVVVEGRMHRYVVRKKCSEDVGLNMGAWSWISLDAGDPNQSLSFVLNLEMNARSFQSLMTTVTIYIFRIVSSQFSEISTQALSNPFHCDTKYEDTNKIRSVQSELYIHHSVLLEYVPPSLLKDIVHIY